MDHVYSVPRCGEGQIDFTHSPVVALGKPALWTGNEGGPTEVQAAWNRSALHVGFRLHGSFVKADDRFVTPETPIGNDDRVEVLIMPPGSQTYYVYEVGAGGRDMTYCGRFHRQFNWQWQGGHRASLARSGGLPFVTVTIPWDDLGIMAEPPARGVRASFCRGEGYISGQGNFKMAWTCWIDPGTEKKDFHIPETFGELVLTD